MRIDAAFIAQLNAAAGAAHITPAVLFDGAWAILLGRHAARRDVMFGMAVSGRDADVPGIDDVFTLFARLLPLRVQILDEHDLRTWLRTLQSRRLEVLEHQHLSDDEIRQYSALTAEAPLFRSFITFENFPIDLGAFRSLDLEVVLNFASTNAVTHYPLGIAPVPVREGMDVVFSYDTAHFDAGTIATIAAEIEQILRAMLTTPVPKGGFAECRIHDESRWQGRYRTIRSSIHVAHTTGVVWSI